MELFETMGIVESEEVIKKVEKKVESEDVWTPANPIFPVRLHTCASYLTTITVRFTATGADPPSAPDHGLPDSPISSPAYRATLPDPLRDRDAT